MKQKFQTKIDIVLNHREALTGVIISLVLILAPYLSSTLSTQARAETISEEIGRLMTENSSNHSALDRLRKEAVSYEDAIHRMEAEIANLQALLNINVSEQARLESEILQAEAELSQQKDLLGKNIRAIYIEGEMSTIEMLASSNDLSEYIDKQQYRETIKAKIQSIIDDITLLRHQLNEQKRQVDGLVTEQGRQRDVIAAAKSEQAQLLSMNKSQQSDFDNKIKANSDRLKQLISSQMSANFTDGGYYFIRFPGMVRSFDSHNYDYRNYGHSQADAPCPGPPTTADSLDRWGYCTRQCVSYAAWAVMSSGRDAPMYWGDAKNWVSKAYLNSIPVYRTPEPGDVAISTSGYWGHAMYVESVNYSDSTFKTSEYNTSMDGRLHYMTRKF